jgi:hypothetical protein
MSRPHLSLSGMPPAAPAANPTQKPIPKSLINSDQPPERQVYHA